MIAVQSIMIASVKATLAQNPLLEGDVATLVIEAEGNDIIFPELEDIAGIKISGTSTTRSMISINGKMKKTLIRKYNFSPRKEMIIPAYELSVDGQKFTTKPINLKIKKDKKGAKKTFIFEQKVDKEEVYVGEPVKLTYTFKHRLDVELAEASFNAPPFPNFWTKTMAKVPNKIEDGYKVYTINYLLYPQKSGDLTIESGRMNVGILVSQTRDFFNFQQAKWKTLYSNPTTLKVKALPEGVTTYGDYTFTVVADKNVTKANEPVNLTITIQGDGNMDDLDAFEIKVPDATVYADKPLKNIGVFKQKFAIVSDRNFTIPSVEFSFFNGEVQKRHSKAFDIEVINSKVTKAVGTLEKKDVSVKEVIKEKIVYKSSSTMTIMITALLSFLTGILASWLYRRYKNSKVKIDDSPLSRRLKNAKDDKALLSLLLPFVDKTPQMQGLIKKLEENVYAGKSHIIDRNKLSKEFDSYLKISKEEEILHV